MDCIKMVVTMNPCPCGHYPSLRCSCTPSMIRRYQDRISGPLLERIDLTVEVPAVRYEMLRQGRKEESSAQIRERVKRARQIQKERYMGSGYEFNAGLDQNGLRKFCALGKEEEALVREAYEKLQLSVRVYHRILKVARTIADMDQSERIRTVHLQEAFCYRGAARKYWEGRT